MPRRLLLAITPLLVLLTLSHSDVVCVVHAAREEPLVLAAG